MIARGPQVEDQLKAGDHAGKERVGGARLTFVGIVYDDGRVVSQGWQGELERLELIGEAVSTIVEVSAHKGGSPRRADEKIARGLVGKRDLPACITIDVAAQNFLGAVELGKIIAGENLRGGISTRGTDDAGALVASDLNVDLTRREMRDREVKQHQLVLGRHPGNFGENIGEAAIVRMPRGRELLQMIEAGPTAAAIRDESVEVQDASIVDMKREVRKHRIGHLPERNRQSKATVFPTPLHHRTLGESERS